MPILLYKKSKSICIFLEPEMSLQKRNLSHINHSNLNQSAIWEYKYLKQRLDDPSLKRFKNQHPGEKTAWVIIFNLIYMDLYRS